MPDKYFLDTNILVYSFDNSSIIIQQKAIELLENLFVNNNYISSSQVVGEFCNVALNKMTPSLTVNQIQEFIGCIPDENVILPGKKDYVHAVELQNRYSLSFWDSLIIQAALSNDCSVLLSEDMHHGQKLDHDLKIINPFK